MLKRQDPNSFYLIVRDFDLKHTLECGQAFRWSGAGDGEYSGVIGGSVVKLKQSRNRLYVRASNGLITPLLIRSYLDLTLDLPYIYNKIGKDKHIRSAISGFGGLRIMRQPFWECLSSFIVSAYNNIPRIKGIIYNISRCFGKPLSMGESVDYSFPGPEAFMGPASSRLASCGVGFRMPYLQKAAAMFLKKGLDPENLKKAGYGEAKQALMQLDGVGEKVADCVLLYSVGRLEAFPVDVWIKRIMEEFYFGGKKTSEKKIREFAGEYFGGYAGYAQQYLYHYGRSRARRGRDG